MKYSTLEEYFNKTKPPKMPFKFSECETIVDYDKFVKNHLAVVKTGKAVFKPYYSRMIKLKELIG